MCFLSALFFFPICPKTKCDSMLLRDYTCVYLCREMVTEQLKAQKYLFTIYNKSWVKKGTNALEREKEIVPQEGRSCLTSHWAIRNFALIKHLFLVECSHHAFWLCDDFVHCCSLSENDL